MGKVSHIQKEKCKLGDSIPLLSIKTDVGLRKIIGDYMNRYKKYDSYIVAKWFNTPCMTRNIEKGILVRIIISGVIKSAIWYVVK